MFHVYAGRELVLSLEYSSHRVALAEHLAALAVVPVNYQLRDYQHYLVTVDFLRRASC